MMLVGDLRVDKEEKGLEKVNVHEKEREIVSMRNHYQNGERPLMKKYIRKKTRLMQERGYYLQNIEKKRYIYVIQGMSFEKERKGSLQNEVEIQ